MGISNYLSYSDQPHDVLAYLVRGSVCGALVDDSIGRFELNPFIFLFPYARQACGCGCHHDWCVFISCIYLLLCVLGFSYLLIIIYLDELISIMMCLIIEFMIMLLLYGLLLLVVDGVHLYWSFPLWLWFLCSSPIYLGILAILWPLSGRWY